MVDNPWVFYIYVEWVDNPKVHEKRNWIVKIDHHQIMAQNMSDGKNDGYPLVDLVVGWFFANRNGDLSNKRACNKQKIGIRSGNKSSSQDGGISSHMEGLKPADFGDF